MKYLFNKLKSKQIKGKYNWVIFLFFLGLAGLFFFYQEQKHPALMAYGKRDWSLTCEGKGRVYRLKSQNTLVSRGTWTEKSLYGRDLLFLDGAGKILFITSLFDSNSLDKDKVWRFRCNQEENFRDRLDHLLFKKTEKYPFLHKMFTKLFQKDWREYKDKNPKKALYGDEKVFEIAQHFNSLTVILKSEERLQIPCQALP